MMNEIEGWTPGPWTTDGYKVVAPGMPRIRFGDNGEYEHDYIVCQPSLYVSPKWGSEEMLANAKLIASAPQQQAIIDNLRAVLVEQREAINDLTATIATLRAQVAIPDEVAQTMRKVLEYHHYIASCVDDTISPDMRRLARAITWLDQQKGHEGQDGE